MSIKKLEMYKNCLKSATLNLAFSIKNCVPIGT